MFTTLLLQVASADRSGDIVISVFWAAVAIALSIVLGFLLSLVADLTWPSKKTIKKMRRMNKI